jgi:hypothetical protein
MIDADAGPTGIVVKTSPRRVRRAALVAVTKNLQ